MGHASAFICCLLFWAFDYSFVLVDDEWVGCQVAIAVVVIGKGKVVRA